MSTNRPPHPNGDPHNHDLQPARWADASDTDADALDALLNEIAQGNGSPGTRSGYGRQRPDARTDDDGSTGEADALRAAARSFHRRFDAAQGRDPGSAALDPHLWEQIMTGTTNPASQPRQAQGALWRNATRNVLAPGVPSRSQQHPTQRWAPVANATLALVILLAGFGIWRVYDGLNGSGPADPEGMTPGIAMRPATPEGTEVLTVDAPPVATPAPITACDFSADIPLFPEVDVSPIDGTALLLTTSGDLVLTCPEEPMGVVLASRVQTTLPLNWPGIVFLSTGSADPAEQSLSAINVLMGESVEIGMHPDGMLYQLHNDPSSPWLVAPDDENPNDWAITDLRTMESRLLSEYAASSAADGMEILTTANGAIAIGLQTPESAESDGALFEGVDLPGNLLVIDGSLDAPRWIGLPDDLPRITEMLLAPDGRHLALKTTEDGDIPTGNTTYSIVRVSDGAEVVRSGTFEDPMSTMRWVQGGEGLAFTNTMSLMLLSTAATSGTAPVTLLDGNDAFVELSTTYDPEVVTVRRLQAEEVATETPGLVQPRVYSVNTVTGEVIEFDGVDISQNGSAGYADTRFMVMGDTPIQDMNAETATFQVVDTVTGEVLDELVNIHLSQDPNGPMMELRSVASTDDGRTEVIGFGASQLYLLRDVQGTLEMRQLPSPNGEVESYIGSVPLWLASDGSRLSLTIDGDESRTRYMIDLTDPDAAWVTIPSTVPGEGPAGIVFVAGTGP